MKGLPAVDEATLARLVVLVREETGNVIPRARHGFLEEIVARRTRTLGLEDTSHYAMELAAGRLDGEWEQLIPLITVKESYFFRAPQQFAAIERHVLPGLLQARAAERRLRIWSAAAARGEEAATLALILSEHESLSGWDWRIVATDLDLDALAAAERGLYGERAVAQVPPRLLASRFTRRGELFELDPALRARIDYRPLNLVRPPYDGVPEEIDLILLRNVLIYFRRPVQRQVVTEISRRLTPEGFLFLGASETLWQISEGLVPVDLGDCFGYRQPEAAAADPRAASRPLEKARPGEKSRPVTKSRPAPPQPSPRAPATAPEAPGKRKRVARPTLLEIATAGATEEPVVADEIPPEVGEGPPSQPGGGAHARLLESARALAHNRAAEAARLAAAARSADPSEPAVYALEGFIHDLAGRVDEAVGAYRAALYLDPALFQARVLLADCLRRVGSQERAEREFQQVLASLANGSGRELVLLEELPLPNRARAEKLCRQALAAR